MTFKEWADIWLEDYKRGTVKANTFETTYKGTFRLYLIPKFGEMPLEALTKREFSKYLNSLSEKYSASLLNKIRICAKSMYEAAVCEGYASVNPAAGVHCKSFVPKVQKFTYSAEEAETLFNYAAQHRYGLGVCIMLSLGLRCSEMLGLKWKDIDFAHKTVSVSRASVAVNGRSFVSTPKSESSVRVLPAAGNLIALLRANKSGNSEFIISAPSGGAYTPANYTKNRYNVFFADFVRDTGIKRLSPHELRHTCGTLLYAGSGDIYAVSKYLGHSSVAVTTKFYMHPTTELLRLRLGIK